MSSILILSGSPRKNGNTDSLVASFSRGALSTGNTVEIIRVSDLDIAPCSGCGACEDLGNHICVIHDEMDIIYKAMMCHDVLVIASPLYFYSISAQMKTVVDRFHTPLRERFSVRQIALIAVGAAVRKGMFEGLLAQYKLIISYFHLLDLGTILIQNAKSKDDVSAEAREEAFRLGASVK